MHDAFLGLRIQIFRTRNDLKEERVEGEGIMMLAQPYYGSFPLSGTVRFGTVQYSTVRNYLRFHSEVVKGTKIANRTTLLVPFRWGT